jgi:exopolysaccharide production protein ExoZ
MGDEGYVRACPQPAASRRQPRLFWDDALPKLDHGARTISSLQTLRFVAAAMVLYVHAAQAAHAETGSWGLLGNLYVVGHAGVDIFFVISGVIITRTAQGLSWKEFAWRRFRRFAPMYLIISMPIFFAIVFGSDGGFDWRQVLANLFLWPATDRLTWPLLSSAWTLCFEILFYAAVTAVLFDRRFLLVAVGLFVGSMALRSAGAICQFLGHPLILEFLFGVAVAYMPRWPRAVWCLPIGAAASLVSALSGFRGTADIGLGEDDMFYRVLAYGLPAAMIVLGTMQIDAKPSMWTFLGDASYTLYLTHPIPLFCFRILLFFLGLSPLFPADLFIIISALLSILLAWRVYVRVEAPLLKLVISGGDLGPRVRAHFRP